MCSLTFWSRESCPLVGALRQQLQQLYLYPCPTTVGEHATELPRLKLLFVFSLCGRCTSPHSIMSIQVSALAVSSDLAAGRCSASDTDVVGSFCSAFLAKFLEDCARSLPDMSTGTVSEDGLFKNVFCKSDLPFTIVYSLILQKQLPVESPRQVFEHRIAFPQEWSASLASKSVLQERSDKCVLQECTLRVWCKSKV